MPFKIQEEGGGSAAMLMFEQHIFQVVFEQVQSKHSEIFFFS